MAAVMLACLLLTSAKCTAGTGPGGKVLPKHLKVWWIRNLPMEDDIEFTWGQAPVVPGSDIRRRDWILQGKTFGGEWVWSHPRRTRPTGGSGP